MRYLRNREFARQLLLSLLLWALAVALCLLCFPGQRGCAVISGALGLAFTALWTGFTVRRYRKLEELASAADQLLHGGRPLNLKEYQEGELAILANELEKLISRLQEQSDRLQREQRYLCDSLADISHQLRTPLTSLNLLLARLPGERDEGERRRRIYEAGQLQERISRASMRGQPSSQRNVWTREGLCGRLWSLLAFPWKSAARERSLIWKRRQPSREIRSGAWRL